MQSELIFCNSKCPQHLKLRVPRPDKKAVKTFCGGFFRQSIEHENTFQTVPFCPPESKNSTGGWPPKWLDGAAAHTGEPRSTLRELSSAQPIGSRGLGGGSGTP